MAKVESFLSPLAFPSVAKSIRCSFAGCPAPSAAEVLSLARSFQGLGVVAVRPSGRSFSGWVAVCSFRDRNVASSFSEAAASQLLGENCFCAVRPAGRRYRVSVPCLNPPLLAVRPKGGVKLSRYRVQIGF